MIARAATPVVEHVGVDKCERFGTAAGIDSLDDAPMDFAWPSRLVRCGWSVPVWTSGHAGLRVARRQ
jgi:hypothetical protein